MGQTIAMFLDGRVDREVRRLWDVLASAGLPSLADAVDSWPPHISLVGAASFEGVDWEGVRSAAGVDALTVEFDGYEVFPGEEGAMFVRVRPSPELVRVQADVYRSLVDQGVSVGAYYRPDIWRPHCTLAIGMTDAVQQAEAFALLEGSTIGAAAVVRIGTGYPAGGGWTLRGR